MKVKTCMTCGGTGWQLIDRSWFRSDGMSRIRCGICAGSGKSNYRDDPKFVQGQKRRRALAEAEGE